VSDRFFEGYRGCAAFTQMFRVITPEWFAGLAPVPVPAVLLWGEHDRVLSDDQVGAWRPLVPGARERIVQGWGHFPMLEQPAEYAEEVARLARQLAGAASPA
jgi:pimeloyl-ACP methyl ester carboxylesterase